MLTVLPMLTLLRNARLKYKFWLLNILVLAVHCLLVLSAMYLMAEATETPFWTIFMDTAPTFAVIVTVLMLLEMAGSQVLISFIERQVNRLKTTMVSVQQSGDLSQRAVVNSRDEIGEMSAAFNAMQDRTGSVVKSMKTAITHLQQEVNELTTAANQRRDELQRQQQNADHSVAVIENLLHSFLAIADQAGTARELSHQAKESAQDGSQRVASSTASIQSLATVIRTATTNVGALAENSEEISKAVTEIRGIAEQTNLLALNAAIEAARAGEQGRGFAVVADEVRKLAQRVQDSTDQIQATMDRLLSAMDTSMQEMEISSGQADTCVQQANDARDALEQIQQVVTQINHTNLQIAQVSDEQSGASDEALQSVHSIRDATATMVSQLVASADMNQRLQDLIKSLEQAAADVQVD